MTYSLLDDYATLIGGGDEARLAILACSAALRLDDEIAEKAIELVAGTNGSTRGLVNRIKDLDCVWRQYEGSWYVIEEVRRDLSEEFRREVPERTRMQLSALLAAQAEQRAESFAKNGQATEYWTRQAKFEAAYQRMVIPEQSDRAAEVLAEIWESSSYSGAQATAESADYLSAHIQSTLSRVPVHLVFLQGMAARARRDKRREKECFCLVWENGRHGHIFAVAAHLFGRLERNKGIAERALRDSLDWDENPYHQAQVYHSLGNLLAKDQARWADAEDAYADSLRLDKDPAGWAQVYHSLGNLLAKDETRLAEAEDAYAASLGLYKDSYHQAQVYHSMGNLFAEDKNRWAEAEDAYAESLGLDKDSYHQAQVLASWADLLSKTGVTQGYEQAELLAGLCFGLDAMNPWTTGICHRVLAEIYIAQGRNASAIEELEALKVTNRKLGKRGFERRINDQIAQLRQQLREHDQGA